MSRELILEQLKKISGGYTFDQLSDREKITLYFLQKQLLRVRDSADESKVENAFDELYAFGFHLQHKYAAC